MSVSEAAPAKGKRAEHGTSRPEGAIGVLSSIHHCVGLGLTTAQDQAAGRHRGIAFCIAPFTETQPHRANQDPIDCQQLGSGPPLTVEISSGPSPPLRNLLAPDSQ